MIPALYLLLLIALSPTISAQLTVEKIMREASWIGTSPTNPTWTQDGQYLYFNWNPTKSISDSLYYISLQNKVPMKAIPIETHNYNGTGNYIYNLARTQYVFAKDGDIFIGDTKTNKLRRITQTVDPESAPRFSFNETAVVYNRGQNLYAWDIITGETRQLTHLRGAADGAQRSTTPTTRTSTTGTIPQEEWMKNDQLQYFQVLKERKDKREKGEAYTKSIPKPKELRNISIEDKTLSGLNISPNGRYISYNLTKQVTNAKTTIVPNYVTESGFTTDIAARTKVGAPQSTTEFFIYDRENDTVWVVRTDSIPGIRDLPDYLKDYPRQLEERKKKNVNREVVFVGTSWSPKGTHVAFDVRSADNKDRWLIRWDTATRQLKLIDRQRDEAWIGGPGVSNPRLGWLDEDNYWFQSETTGYSHLYTINVATGTRRALTSGNYEVQQAQLSLDKKSFFITTNEIHPGDQQFFRLNVATGKKERITSMPGANQVSVSRDEKHIAILHSSSNKPWELYIQENKPGGKIEQVTTMAQSAEFKTYAWREPEVVTFPARDGAMVYARLYKPANPHPNKPAVIFVHGAGYLQNAHKWWSQYFREYMFNNLLADQGYVVLDIDYRGSSGYGRDWRTGIYRYMGGKDLSDHTDGVNWLVKNHGVNPKHVGIYGGSYGGFITLMGLFTEPEVYAAGGALRSVTDWANYNHQYTSNILNEPYTDSIAYRRSSPLYFAEGLKGHLLMCHGMVDVNVHFQDIIKLSQRLIELGKDNWELAVYPMEDHAFVEASSWTDEYKRVLKLFEMVLKR
ncbi:MAG: S9 family peptidase [Chitinophagaceae bacterium]|nr:S9 family peptidase [Chitinophagaceae bacterium]